MIKSRKKEGGFSPNPGLWIICLLIVAIVCVSMWSANYEKKYRLLYIPKVMDQENGFWTSLIAGTQMGAEENGVDLVIKGPDSEDDVETQIKLLEDCILDKPDALLISPNEYSSLDEVLMKVKEAGIPIILVDSVVSAEVARCTVATDNYEAGKILGSYAEGLVDEDSFIGIIGHVKDSSTAMERKKGIEDALGEDADKILKIEYCNSSFVKAYELTRDMMEEYPRINIMIGTNEYAAVGVARAIRDMGLEEKVHVLGFDSSLEETQLLEEGIFECIVIQKPFNMGYLGVEEAVKLLKNKQVEAYIDSGCKLITKGNMYEDENQKLLYPFVERK